MRKYSFRCFAFLLLAKNRTHRSKMEGFECKKRQKRDSKKEKKLEHKIENIHL